MTAVHPRQQIRRAVVDLLRGQTPAEDRVLASRVVPWRVNQLPAIAVYALREQVDPVSESRAPRVLTRMVDLAIEAALIWDQTIDDAIDGMALAIERALHADDTLADTAAGSLLQSTTVDLSAEGQAPIGLLTLVYRVTYETGAPEAADVTLDDLATVDVRTNVGGVEPVLDEVQDRLEDLNL